MEPRPCRRLRAPRHRSAQQDSALEHLEFIRDTMARSASFTAVPGLGLVMIGITALIAALIASRQRTPELWMLVWFAEAIVAVSIDLLTMWRKAGQAGSPLFSGPGRKVVLGLAPALAAGAFLTVVFYRANLSAALPAMWLLLYGVAVVAAGAFSVRPVPLMGAAFMGLGIAAIFSPTAWRDIYMAAGFGGLHVLFGIHIARRYGG
jgi:hypothetical protein